MLTLTCNYWRIFGIYYHLIGFQNALLCQKSHDYIETKPGATLLIFLNPQNRIHREYSLFFHQEWMKTRLEQAGLKHSVIIAMLLSIYAAGRHYHDPLSCVFTFSLPCFTFPIQLYPCLFFLFFWFKSLK